MAQKYIRSEYNGTVVLSNIRKGRVSIPVFGMNETYTATKVNQWYDGSPMDDSKADGSVYLKLIETGEYFLVNLPNKGELFLEKDTMAQMRGLNFVEILLLKMGYYKGVKLNGYYTKGDTPAPIEYFLSSTTNSDDGGSVIEVGGIKLEHEFVGDINIKYFGAKGEDSQNIYQHCLNCLNYALENGNNIYFPSGTYNTFTRNFPFRKLESDTSSGLRDLKGIEIYGDGLLTVLKTESTTGADVLQLNSIRNFTVRNLSITADLLAYEHAGSNGVSITNGFDNINIIDVHCFDLAGVPYSGPAQLYIDGAKAFTIQSSNGNINYHGKATIKGTCNNCAYGFEHSGFMDDIYNGVNLYDVTVDITTDKSYQGCAISFAPPTSILDEEISLPYNLNITVINSQQDFNCNRLFGANINVYVKSNETDSELKTNPLTGGEWLDGTSTRMIYIGALKNSILNITGYKHECENYGSIGAIGSLSEPYYNGGINRCDILLSVNGNFDNEITAATNAEGHNVSNSNLVMNYIDSIPTLLFSVTKKNNFIINGVPFMTESNINRLFFKSDPSKPNNQRIEANDNSSIDVIGQRTGASAFLSLFRVFGYSDSEDKLFFEVLNGGGIRISDNNNGDVKISIGTLIPEGNVEGKSGDIYIRTGDSGGSRITGSIWFKFTVSGNTGWIRMDAGAATLSNLGLVKQSASQANTSASDVATLVSDFNSLLSKLRTAGILAT